MKQKRKKEKTLRTRLLFAIMAVIILQTLVVTTVIQMAGTKRQLEQSAESIFENAVKVQADDIEEQMIAWSNIKNLADTVTERVSGLEEKYQLPGKKIMEDAVNRKNLLRQMPEDILKNLRQTGANGSFIILDDGIADGEYDMLYLRDLNPQNNPANNYDILVETGNSKDVLAHNFTMDTLWSARLKMNTENSFYQKPFDAGNIYPEVNQMDLGYWSHPFRIRKNDMEIITYTVPLLDSNHHSYGVIGIGISKDYFESFLKDNEIAMDPNGSMCLSITRNGEEFEPILIGGNYYKTKIDSRRIHLKTPILDANKLVKAKWEGQKESTVAEVETIKLYNSNTPFEGEQWTIVGMGRESVVYQSVKKLFYALAIALAAALFISIVGAVFITSDLVRPIRRLIKGLHTTSLSHFNLPKTYIHEIDELAKEIERLSVNAFKAGSKVADIIEMSNISLGVFEYELKNSDIFCTKKVEDIIGIPMPSWNKNYVHREEFEKAIEEFNQRIGMEPIEEDVYPYKMQDGTKRYIRIKQMGTPERKLCLFVDVSIEIREKEKIKYDRDFDVLTKLYNRRAFAREVAGLLEKEECPNGVISIWDLDNLKFINDTYGHDMGDKYICLLADTLLENMTEHLMVARMSGDEFMAFSYKQQAEENYGVLESIHKQFLKRRLLLPDGNSISVSVSAGMALYGKDAITYDELVKHADFAMYEIKNSEKGGIKRFSRDSYLKDYILVQGVGELNRILQEESVQYAFQPIVDVREKKIIAYEALIRPISDLLNGPYELLRLATKESKLKQIESMTWFLAMKTFFGKKDIPRDVKLFINSLPNQCLTTEEFIELEDLYGDKLSRVVMETTEESQINRECENIKRQWRNKWNILNALDDFGAGYSNTDILVTREFHFVKLDISMVRDIHLSQSKQKLVLSIIEYCHENKIKVIAEGIETKEELDEVVKLGTDYIQGYYLAKPSFELITIADIKADI
ncbi:MAG: EAL domain-containing protein [Acetivibrio sp.]